MKMNLPQRGTALLLCMLLLFSALTPAAGALDNNYIFALTFPDIQCAKHSSDQTYPSSNGAWNNNPVTWQNLSAWINNCCGGRDTVHDVAGNAVYLAKNEREGFQIYFFEQSSSGRSLRVEVSPFVNDDGQILPHTLYKEEYFTAWVNNDYIDPVADALIPYHGEAFDTQCGTNDVIYAQLHAAKDQPAGNYVSEISMYDGEDLLRRETVTAVVWNFALPEGHYASVVCGMYDTASSYTATRGFLELSGIRFDTQGEVLPADCDRAEEILEGWTDFLLDHGVTTLELPRWLIDDDPKAAELAMADPRRKAFAVPLENTDILDQGGRIDYDEPTKEKVLQYKNLAYHNRFLRNKALFHLINEPGWVNDTDVANAFTCRSDAIEAMWPGYHGVSPYKGDGNQTLYLNTLRKDRDIFCLSQEPFCSSSVLRSAYTSGDWFRTWRYPAGNCNGTALQRSFSGSNTWSAAGRPARNRSCTRISAIFSSRMRCSTGQPCI